MRGTLWSEWGKTWSVRAPGACLLATALVVVVTSASLANDAALSVRDGELPMGTTMPAVDPVAAALQFGQLALAAFALQLICAEYSTGLIRSTLLAQPRRHLVLLSKTAVAAVCGAVLGAALGASATVTSSALLGDQLAAGPSATLTAGRSAVMLGCVAALVVGLGAVVRSAVGTLATAAVLLVGTLALPGAAGQYAPGQAGAALLAGRGDPYPASVAALVLLAWAVAAVGTGAWLMRHRDA